MKANEVFPSRFIKAADLGQSQPVVVIEDVKIEEINKEGDHKPVIYFRGKEKALCCNKTNWNTLVKLLGDETDDWIGRSIKLMVQEVSFKGEQMEAIRVSCQAVGLPAMAPQQATRTSRPLPGRKGTPPAPAPSPAREPEEAPCDMPDLAPDDVPF